MRELMEQVLEGYGQRVILTHGAASAEIKGFLQAVRSKSDAAPYQVTALGTADNRPWVLLCRETLGSGDTVVCGQRRFTVCSSQPVSLGGEDCYWWAVLETMREAAK